MMADPVSVSKGSATTLDSGKGSKRPSRLDGCDDGRELFTRFSPGKRPTPPNRFYKVFSLCAWVARTYGGVRFSSSEGDSVSHELRTAHQRLVAELDRAAQQYGARRSFQNGRKLCEEIEM